MQNVHSLATRRVAVVHEWMASYAGSERVLEQILHLFPDADLYSVADFLSNADRVFLGGRVPRTSFVQRLPGAARRYRKYLPLMPLAVEGFDLSEYDLVISSSHSVAKGVLTRPGQLHVCYCHSPIRYAWDLQHEYLSGAGMHKGFRRAFARLMLHYMRLWDVRTSPGVDHFICNSKFVANRVWKVYRRESAVVYPPVDTEYFTPSGSREEFYFTCSRLVPYKRVDCIIEAFARMPDRKLVVAGDGPLLKQCQRAATSNVRVLGYQSTESIRDLMRRAKAFVFAAEEDFGIIVAEAQACGTPVICYSRGGSSEIVSSPDTGVLFSDKSPSALADAVREFERDERRFDTVRIRSSAERFSRAAFRTAFSRSIDEYILGSRNITRSGISR